MRGERYRWVCRFWRDLNAPFGCAHLVLVGESRGDSPALCGARPSENMRWDPAQLDGRKCRKCSNLLRPNSVVVEPLPDPAAEVGAPQSMSSSHTVLLVQGQGRVRVFHAQDPNALHASALALLKERCGDGAEADVATILDSGDGPGAWDFLVSKFGEELMIARLEGPCSIAGCIRHCPFGRWRDQKIPRT